uniref:DUF1279 domain-containing protein n=1 Tax=Timema genevievae TaxID=629358 RepID=A0A7R9JV97_TIMGE|nr:unnamed protein product [Timema genevievae]
MSLHLVKLWRVGHLVVNSEKNVLRNLSHSSIYKPPVTGTNNAEKSVLSEFRTAPSSQNVHVTANMQYPAAKPIPLPSNVEDIDAAEKARFSPHRERDIAGPVITCKTSGSFGNGSERAFNSRSSPSDPHIASYDCMGTLSLNCTMQTNVPEPFSATGKATHLNMPGGQWDQGNKRVSEDMQNLHYANVNHMRVQENASPDDNIKTGTACQILSGSSNSKREKRALLTSACYLHQNFVSNRQHMLFNTVCFSSSASEVGQPSRKEKLKRAVKEYGSTVIVFHVGISLLSLGGFYLAVSSGLDVAKILTSLGISAGEVAAGASTFVMAYAVHKVFAPVRISITLASTPFIVRYLRSVGFLKPPKSTP